jgi:hypothetical protein
MYKTRQEESARKKSYDDDGKVKVKLSLCFTKYHAMKTYWGSGGIAPRITNLGTRRLAALPLGKNTWYPLNRRLGESQSRSGP